MKKFIIVLTCLLSFVLEVHIKTGESAMPSVSDVFAGLSEAEIAQQVQEAQKLLEDLEKNGSPEDKAAFEQLLMETLNSMSDEDLQDIQNIAKMVEPHLDLPKEEEIKQEVSAAKPEEKKIEVSTDAHDLETFQNMIQSIAQRIDDLVQKMHSSKDATEQVDHAWSSKTTFNNLKRQLLTLKIERLAKKLIKKDLEGEEKELVEKLKNFLKELDKHNSQFIIEDDFGLPTSYAHEKKYLKKTKEILATFDDYIDSLMPLLEKFLRKWDPEALAMAKESEEKSKKAAKDATDALARKASPDAVASRGGGSHHGSYNKNQGQNYGSGGYGSGGYSDYGDYPSSYPGYGYGNQLPGFDEGSVGAGASGSGSPQGATKAKENTVTPKTNTSQTNATSTGSSGHGSTKRKSSGDYQDALDNLETHLETYDIKYEQELIKDLEGYVNSFDAATDESTQMIVITLGVLAKELTRLTKVLDDVQKDAKQLDQQQAKKFEASQEIKRISSRLEKYKYILDKLDDTVRTGTVPQINEKNQKALKDGIAQALDSWEMARRSFRLLQKTTKRKASKKEEIDDKPATASKTGAAQSA